MDMSKSEEDLQLLSTQKWVMFGGGSADKASGDRVSKYVHLQTFIASTECFIQGIQLMNGPKERDCWDYFQFSPEHADVEFHEQQPGHYEQVLARKSECDTNAVFSIFPDIHEYKTSDLMERHPDPSKSDFYKFTGRTDDLIAFSNAAKFSPLAYEEHILGNHLVKAAIMVGIQRPCAALLLELADSDMSKDEALEKVWPTVENANTAAPKHAQVRKEMVLIATKEKPFERASKETPIRGRTLELYEDEINAIYDRYGENWQTRNGNIGKV